MKDKLLLTQDEAARALGFSVRTLEKWRWAGGGPPFVAVSRRCVRYRPEDLRRWSEERLLRSTSDRGGA